MKFEIDFRNTPPSLPVLLHIGCRTEIRIIPKQASRVKESRIRHSPNADGASTFWKVYYAGTMQ